MIFKHIDKENLHHAYLIEGPKEDILPAIFKLLLELKIDIKNNPDFYSFEVDTFKIDDARNLKGLAGQKSFSGEEDSKKIFLISANSFLLEAQNSLLKIFEEPIKNTHFFVVAPSLQVFIPTLLSRFYVIKNNSQNSLDTKEAENFIKLPLIKRIDFLKELLASDDDEEGDIVSEKNSPRTKALNFLNSLEVVLHKNSLKSSHLGLPQLEVFVQIFKVRKYLRQPGSSTKSLMESVALSIPEKML